MRGWKTALLTTATWLIFLVAATWLLPSWLSAGIVLYVAIGPIVTNLLRITAPIDHDRFDFRGVLRGWYWDLWWPIYLARKLS